MIRLFYGEEDFLIEEEINDLKSKIANPSLNLETFDGSEPNLEKIAQALQTQPFFGEGKLVMIKNADLNLKVWENIFPLLENISPKTQLVFIAGRIDKRSKFYKFIEEKGEVQEFKSFAEWEQEELLAWIVKQVKLLGKKIGSHAARILQEISGRNLQSLASEIDKLATYVGDRDAIEEKDVRSLAFLGEIAYFSLIEALRKKNLSQVLEIFSKLVQQNEEPLALLSLLARELRMMLQVKSLQKSASDAYQIARKLGTRPYFVKKSLEASYNFTLEELIRDLELLHEADVKMKTGEDQITLMELLLVELCGYGN